MFGSERRWDEPNSLKRWWLAAFGWRQIGPRIRYWHIEQALRGAAPRSMVELGCGWGQNVFALRRRFPKATLVGIDPDRRALALARRIAQHAEGAPVHWIEAAAPPWPAQAAGPFDAALVVDVLEYIAEDRAVLAGIRERLRPGGLLLVHVPRRITEQRRILPVSHEVPGHARPEYTRAEIRATVEAAGFTVRDIRGTFGFWGTLAWELGRLIERLGPAAALLFPMLLPLARLDCWGRRVDGNGYFMIAEPRHG